MFDVSFDALMDEPQGPRAAGGDARRGSRRVRAATPRINKQAGGPLGTRLQHGARRRRHSRRSGDPVRRRPCRGTCRRDRCPASGRGWRSGRRPGSARRREAPFLSLAPITWTAANAGAGERHAEDVSPVVPPALFVDAWRAAELAGYHDEASPPAPRGSLRSSIRASKLTFEHRTERILQAVGVLGVRVPHSGCPPPSRRARAPS